MISLKQFILIFIGTLIILLLYPCKAIDIKLDVSFGNTRNLYERPLGSYNSTSDNHPSKKIKGMLNYEKITH